MKQEKINLSEVSSQEILEQEAKNYPGSSSSKIISILGLDSAALLLFHKDVAGNRLYYPSESHWERLRIVQLIRKTLRFEQPGSKSFKKKLKLLSQSLKISKERIERMWRLRRWIGR